MIGALDIALETDRGHPAWRLTTTGGAGSAGWLVGRRAEEAALLIPRVFNLCASAHAMAARCALGLPSGDDARHAVTATQERMRDHAVAILCDWPSILGGTPDRAALSALAGSPAHAARALRIRLLGDESDLLNGTARTLDSWLKAGASATARLLAHIRATFDPGWGRAELDRPQPADILAAFEAGAPIAPRETTVADEWRASPMLGELLAREGASLFVRMLARLLDLLSCLDAGGRPAAARIPSPAPGIGLARAARGLLAHRARVVGGMVTDYRILSPSAWNLAPDGLLRRMLAALPMGERTPMLARLVVSCVNPCVPVTLRLGAMEEARHA